MTDELLDAQLHAVPLPEGLLARLRAIGRCDDRELDGMLREVAVPPGLVERLQRLPDDEELDERLREVPAPACVLAAACNIPAQGRRSRLAELALAGSLLLIVGAGYLAPVVGLLGRMRRPPKDATELVLLDRGPLDLLARPDEAWSIAPGAEREGLAGSPTGGESRPGFSVVPAADTVRPGPAGQLLAEMGRAWDPWRNWLIGRWSVLGYVPQGPLPGGELEAVPSAPVRGWDAPRSHALDREFLFSRHAHPPVLLRVDGAVSTVAVPLSTRMESFERASRLIAERRWPEPEQVYVEEFLAAMDYRLAPAEPGRLAIRTAAGPSVFNPASAGLLQVGVKAGGPVPGARASDLTVALDISASMGWDGRLERVRRALARLLIQLRTDDRFSLVVFNEEAVLAVDHCRREDAASVVRVLDGLPAHGNADLGAGLRAGVAAALESVTDQPLSRRLALITDRDFPVALLPGAQAVLQRAREQGLALAIVDVGDAPEADTRLAQLAEHVGGVVYHPRSAEDIRWALFETLTGAPSVVAHEVRLQVAFNPRSVVGYRIVGHEATMAGGLLPGATECDLRVGQEAVVLFELWLRPNDEDEVAVARLRWRDPAANQIREVPAQRISRVQFATAFEGAPLPLQAAAIAAETAEIFRQGYTFELPSATAYRYRPKTRTLQDVLALARRVNPDLAARPEFQQYVAVVEKAHALPGARRSEALKAGTRSLVAGRWRDIGE